MSAVPVLGTTENPGPQNPESKAKTNLIVNYLPQSLTEDEFRNLFSTVGTVQSCKLIKEKASGLSLGYGFINYATEAETAQAIEALNGLPIQSKTLKVSYARPSSAAIKNANIYVANLPKQYSQTELEALFRPYGSIITSKILLDPDTGLAKGVGFVRFDKYAEAEMAISSLNGRQLPGSVLPIIVKFASPPKVTPTGNGSSITTHTTPVTIPKRTHNVNPYIGGGVGPMRHTPTVTSMRFNPVSTLGIPSSTVVPTAVVPGINPVTGSWCIFVYNLPENCEDSLLYQLFSPHGAISSVNLIRDMDGKCKKFGFVNMVNYEEAYQAILHLNDFVVQGKKLQVSFKKPK